MRRLTDVGARSWVSPSIRMLDSLQDGPILDSYGGLAPDCDTCPDGVAVYRFPTYQVCARCFGVVALVNTILLKPKRRRRRTFKG
jgi:hypothetical protein